MLSNTSVLGGCEKIANAEKLELLVSLLFQGVAQNPVYYNINVSSVNTRHSWQCNIQYNLVLSNLECLVLAAFLPSCSTTRQIWTWVCVLHGKF
jgi:hypothetical protein